MGRLFKGVVLGTVLSALFGSWLRKPQGQQVKQVAEDLVRSLVKRSSEVATVTREAYSKIVDTAMAELQKMKSLSERELGELRSELEAKWEEMTKKA
jgi:gas vesicle protein